MTPKLRRPISLAAHVTILVGLTITFCFIVLGLAVQNSINRHFAEQDADELRVVAQAVDVALRRAFQSPTDQIPTEVHLQSYLASSVSGHHGVYFGVFDNSNEPLYQSNGPDLKPLVDNTYVSKFITVDSLFAWKTENHEYRGAVLPIEGSVSDHYSSMTIAVAARTDFHHTFMTAFTRTLWAWMLFASILTIFAAWFAIRAGHRPLHRISEEIKSITSEQLNLRLNPNNVPGELLELVASFNMMISSMEDVFQRLSHFSADIAHELRTPITNLSTQTQVTLSHLRTEEEYREILYSSLEEYNRLSAMVRDMLWLAQTDNKSLELEKSVINLKEEIETLFDYFEAWADEQDIKLRIIGDSVFVHLDRNLFRRALSNLLTNAIKHTTKGKDVTVILESHRDKARVSVQNLGITIPEQHLNHIFDRFYRIDPSRQREFGGEGIGLGLSIVKSIIEAHDGEISVTSAHGTTCFTMDLPLTKD